MSEEGKWYDRHPHVDREQSKREVGEGWGPILDPLYDYVEAHGIKVLQVKEKFGGLRFYTTGREWDDAETPTEFGVLVQAAEVRAKVTCEWCGEPGKLRSGPGFGWMKTLCDTHAERWKEGERWW